jgi:cytolysin-activating lysine-acyltransferase
MHHTHHLQAPQLTGQSNRTSEAFGAAVWLWMQLPRHRQLTIKNLEKRLLEPIRQGQYVLVCTGQHQRQRDPVALLLYACLNARAESRHIKDPTNPLAPADWRSGDRLWLIDWVSPFGQSLQLRHRMLELFARQTARSLHRYPHWNGSRVKTWLGDTCSRDAAQAWWAERPILSGPRSTPAWPSASPWEPTVPAELLHHGLLGGTLV